MSIVKMNSVEAESLGGKMQFDDLPPEVVCHILKYLSVRDLLFMSQVSWKYFNLIKGRWKEFDSFDNRRFLAELFTKEMIRQNYGKEIIQMQLGYYSFLTDEEKDSLEEALTKVIKEGTLELVPQIIEIFTYEELTHVAKYTCSKIGQQIIRKQKKVSQIVMDIITPKLSQLNFLR
jgi:predicted nucleic acid-binding OB-fold protein